MKGERPQRPVNDQEPGFSNGVWDLVQRCWAQDPDERSIIDDVVKTWEQLTSNPRQDSNLPPGDENL
ncbi:hypothetical protein BDM02DRAFT_3109881 [Thelephora ganbajun]|uniref:Uncharacterized protein n=1 Tax=Thelephora ganbajun TaxID=370292 RepID=A0ACB6ZR85_THEGA|nr:hypothetical protein BDM02DRAFT_3109881 [Thelephora ganbajun]